MDMKPVKSTNVLSVGFDSTTGEMRVQFANGVYKFKGVTQEIHDALMAAQSIGKHFHSYIKGHFEQVKPEEEKASA